MNLTIFFFFDLEIEIYTTHTHYLGRVEGIRTSTKWGEGIPCTTRPNA